MFPSWDLFDDFPHDETGLMDLGEGNHRDKGPFSSYHIKGPYEQNFSLLMLTLITWLKVFVGPLPWTFPLFHLSVLSSLEGSTYFSAQYTPKEWGVMLGVST